MILSCIKTLSSFYIVIFINNLIYIFYSHRREFKTKKDTHQYDVGIRIKKQNEIIYADTTAEEALGTARAEKSSKSEFIEQMYSTYWPDH